jgi:hypothetical protein
MTGILAHAPGRNRTLAACRLPAPGTGETAARTDTLLSQAETGKITCVRRPRYGRLSPGAGYTKTRGDGRCSARGAEDRRHRPAQPQVRVVRNATWNWRHGPALLSVTRPRPLGIAAPESDFS